MTHPTDGPPTADGCADPLPLQLGQTLPSSVRAHMRERMRRVTGSDPSDAELIGELIAMSSEAVLRDIELDLQVDTARQRVLEQLHRQQPDIAFQPIFSAGGKLRKVEALSRFDTTPYRTPDLWFREAETAGLSLDLETAALRNALGAFQAFSHRTPVRLAINASVGMILSGCLDDIFTCIDPYRLVIEITEHQAVPCYATMNERLAAMRARGVRIAIDDIGAGNAGIQHVLSLRPDTIKFDRVLVQDIDTDGYKQIMLKAMMLFVHTLGIEAIAEGIETLGELQFLQEIGIHGFQGYLLGRPSSIDQIVSVHSWSV